MPPFCHESRSMKMLSFTGYQSWNILGSLRVDLGRQTSVTGYEVWRIQEFNKTYLH